MDEQNYTYGTTELSHKKRHEILIHAITWMNPENTVNNISQRHKGQTLYDSLYEVPRAGRFLETETEEFPMS